MEDVKDVYKREIVQRVTRNLLDIQILRLVETEPMWGYKIKKLAEARSGLKIRHGALYPLLNTLEKDNFLTSEEQKSGGRKRKVYAATRKGSIYLEAYRAVLQEQLKKPT